MKHLIKTSQPQNGYILESNTQCANACCPTSDSKQTQQSSKPFKKDKRFINITIGRTRQPIQYFNVSAASPNTLSHPLVSTFLQKSQEVFEQDKYRFLQQIRKYTPSLQSQKEEDREKYLKEVDSTKELDITPKTNENSILSNIFENISNELFSDMFVSSSIKGKILMSGSLGSISEAKSDMENSNPTQTIINNLHFTQQR